MRLTTERKVCAGVLSLAVIALGVDRMILGGASGPASASASVQESIVAEPQSPAEAIPRVALAGASVTVARQLSELQTVARDVDAFAPPARWQKALAEARAAEEARGEQPSTASDAISPKVKRFMRHQLTAVLSEGGLPSKALIRVADGETGRSYSKLFGIGEELDGFTLHALKADKGETSATFVDLSSSIAIDLELAMGGEAGGARSSAAGPDKAP